MNESANPRLGLGLGLDLDPVLALGLDLDPVLALGLDPVPDPGCGYDFFACLRCRPNRPDRSLSDRLSSAALDEEKECVW